MGQSQSLLEYKEEPLIMNALEYPYGVWSYEKPKNFDYFFTNKRCFRISRKHYPEYTRGYFYGYYQDLDYWDKESDKEEGEIIREF